MVLLARSLFTL